MILMQKISFQLFFINLLQSRNGTHVHSPLHIWFSNYKTATNYLIGSLSRDMSSTLFGAWKRLSISLKTLELYFFWIVQHFHEVSLLHNFSWSPIPWAAPKCFPRLKMSFLLLLIELSWSAAYIVPLSHLFIYRYGMQLIFWNSNLGAQSI